MGKDSFDSASYSAEYGDTSTKVTKMGGKRKRKRKTRRSIITRKRSLEKAGQRMSSRAGGKSRKTRRR
jgi:hypothetical protein